VALLDRVGLRAGQAAIDLGCGPRGILDLLAARVSPGGQVVGLASGQELDELDAALRPHIEDPRTVVMFGLLFLVWGRKPA
jgi:trans-aconitate methyltransferase